MSAPLILFDGACNLCDSSVRFVMAHDSAQRFTFAPLQSELGRQVLRAHGLESYADLSAIVLLQDGKVFTKSSAAVAIARQLDAPWSLLAIARFLPRRLRDTLYDFVGRRRYRWFGKKPNDA